MQRKKSFVVVLAVIVFGLAARGQEGPAKLQASPGSSAGMGAERSVLPATLDLKRTLDLNKTKQAYSVLPVGQMPPFGPSHGITMNGKLSGAGFNRPLPEDYYTQHFGIMCQKEWQFEKTTHIPLRLRLGSLEQCNYLEGKK